MVLGDRSSEPLSNVDSAWLRMEDSTNLMTITGLMTFKEKLNFARLKGVIEDRLLPFDRFRQRVVDSRIPFRNPRWVDDDSFTLFSHVRRTTLPHPADQGTLQALVSELMCTPLDFSKPLWQFHLVDNYEGGSAVIIRLHHCIADGLALMQVLFSIVDDEPDEGGHEESGAAAPGKQAATPAAGRGWGRSRVNGGMEALFSPGRALSLARESASAVTELGRLLALSSDPATVFKGKLGVAKRAVWSDPIPLAQVKACGKLLGGTVNDVLLAAVAGALRRYMKHRGEDPEGLSIRAVVPVNLRPPTEEIQLGNRFGLVFLPLPVGLASPRERLLALKQEMDALKGSPQAIVAFGVLNALGMASPEIEGVGVSIFARKATAVMTNVPGPQKKLYFAGLPIREIMFWVPQSGRLGLGVSILSYAGTVRLGIAVDAGLIPDPGMIVTYFHEEFAELSG